MASLLTITPFAKTYLKIIRTRILVGSLSEVQLSLLVMSDLQYKQWAGRFTCLSNDLPGNKTRQLTRFLFLPVVLIT